MATTQHWYQDKDAIYRGLARSSWVTSITDWFMSFAGKWAELVLYTTVLYSCAELYPGVHLPAGLNLAVFLVQLGALDIGGLSLAKLARQARTDGNAAGAVNADRLSKWLIGIMLIGVVTVGLEHALPVTLPAWVITTVDVLLVVARSICAVLYGRVVHDLKQELVHMMPVAESDQRVEQIVNQFNERLQVVQSETSQVVQAMIQAQLAEQVQVVHSQIEGLVQASQSTMLEQVGAQLTTAIQEMKRELRSAIAEATVASSVSGSVPRMTLVQKAGPARAKSEPARVRVPRFIQAKVNQGERPSLTEIMDECKCSRNTAIRYRRELLGATDEEGAA